MAEPVVRLTVNVSPEVAQLLDELASNLNTSKTQAVNQAITTAAAMYQAQSEGGQVVIKKGNTEQAVNLPTK